MEKRQLFQPQKEAGYMRTNKWGKWMLLFTVMLSACLAGILPVHAAGKKAVAPMEFITLEIGNRQELVIKKPAKNVTWRTSNSKIAKITKKSGKKNMKVTIVSGKKTGSCLIRADAGNKVYKYRVTVIDKPTSGDYFGKKSKITLVKAKKTGTSFTVRFRVCNAFNWTEDYTSAFELRKYRKGKWYTVPMERAYIYVSLRFPFPEKTSYTTTYDLTKYYDLSKLTKGKYRLYLDYSMVPGAKCYVEFKL